MRRLSITTKITIWYTVFLLVITGCFFGILIYMGNSQASQTARAQLTDAVVDASREIENFGGDFIIDRDLVFYEDGVYISIYDEKGGLIEGRRPAELPELPEFQADFMQRLQDDGGDIWYIYDSRFDIEGESIWVRGIVRDFAEQGTFSFMVRLASVAFPVLVILAAIGGYIITRRGFRPVRQIIETVEGITRDGDLSRRIDTDMKRASKDEIHRLAGTFNGMFDKLEMSFKQEKQFTSDVSHELRTPLAVIISQSDYGKEDESYREKALEVIGREARRMSGLVNRLLTLARSDAGRLQLQREELELSSLLKTVTEQKRQEAASKDIGIDEEIEEGVQVWADEDMIIRVLLNLMDNAVKYGKTGGHINVKLEKSDGFAVCSISDDGIGIAPEHLEHIWERFYRVESARSREGAGLGLSMVSALVKAHGGRTEVQSIEGEGSCFTVVLPLAENTEAEEIS